jgi:hypothetical protein
MCQNAVALQQMTNILGMAMTAKCVRYMLDPTHVARASAKRKPAKGKRASA